MLRTSLSLSAITGKELIIEHIRGKRKKPGLRRQHLVSVKAAAAVCKARVTGDELNSERLIFKPGIIHPGNYYFSIGTAGSCCLVLQTILPILFYGYSSSTVIVEGGTHNPMAPTVDFIVNSFLPTIARFGFHASVELLSYGFYPAGGGKIKAKIRPYQNAARKVEIISRGELIEKKGNILLSRLPEHIAEREKKTLLETGWLRDNEIEIIHVKNSPGPGNVVTVTLRYEDISCVFQSIGKRGKKAEKVAIEAYRAAISHHESKMPVENHLTDQLLIYLGLVSEGVILTSELSLHSRTNVEVIEKFLPVKFKVTEMTGGWQINCKKLTFHPINSDFWS